jgi:hypothetical protein
VSEDLLGDAVEGEDLVAGPLEGGEERGVRGALSLTRVVRAG